MIGTAIFFDVSEDTLPKRDSRAPFPAEVSQHVRYLCVQIGVVQFAHPVSEPSVESVSLFEDWGSMVQCHL
jgi:hypothetical protein